MVIFTIPPKSSMIKARLSVLCVSEVNIHYLLAAIYPGHPCILSGFLTTAIFIIPPN